MIDSNQSAEGVIKIKYYGVGCCSKCKMGFPITTINQKYIIQHHLALRQHIYCPNCWFKK